MITPQLETERLILRHIKADDLQEIFDCWMQDEDVSKYMYWKSSSDISKTKEFIDFELGRIASDDWFRWLIVKKETSEIIGTCVIFLNNDDKAWEIGYNLGKAHWGNGYITEAMKKVLEFAQDRLHTDRIIAVHAAENEASGKVISKLGFKYVKDVPYDCNGGTIHTTGHYYDLHIKCRRSEHK